MSWFKKATSFQGSPSLEGLQFYQPEQIGEFEGIYQSPDFPNVFLGGKEDLQRVKEMNNSPICRIIDVSRYLPEFPNWTQQLYDKYRITMMSIINNVASTIQNTRCPIFVHCEMGANRSVSVLAAAIAKLTGRSVMDILREIKSQRGIAAPHDVYLHMISQNFEPDEKIREKVKQQLEVA